MCLRCPQVSFTSNGVTSLIAKLDSVFVLLTLGEHVDRNITTLTNYILLYFK